MSNRHPLLAPAFMLDTIPVALERASGFWREEMGARNERKRRERATQIRFIPLYKECPPPAIRPLADFSPERAKIILG